MNTQGIYVILYCEIPKGQSVCGISSDASANSRTPAQVVTYVRLVQRKARTALVLSTGDSEHGLTIQLSPGEMPDRAGMDC